MRVVIVSASPLHAQGLAAALVHADGAPAPDVRMVADAAALAEVQADVIVAPVAGAAEGLALQRALPASRPLVLVGPALRAAPLPRALALLAPGASAQTLRAAVQAVAAGLQVRDAVAGVEAFAAADAAADAEPLTAREVEVFELLAKGLSNRDIARALGISAHTAKYHVGQILAKTGSATRAEAVHAGLRQGLIGL